MVLGIDEYVSVWLSRLVICCTDYNKYFYSLIQSSGIDTKEYEDEAYFVDTDDTNNLLNNRPFRDHGYSMCVVVSFNDPPGNCQ